MRTLIPSLTALAASAGALTAGDAPVITWQVDRGAVDALTEVAPLSLLKDPACATAAAHVARQLRLLDAEGDEPPFFTMILDGVWARMEAVVPTRQRLGHDPHLRFVADVGPRIDAAYRQVMQSMHGATTAATQHGFTGFRTRNDSIFVGRSGSLLQFAAGRMPDAPVTAASPARTLELRFNGAQLMQTMAEVLKHEEEDVAAFIDALWGGEVGALKPTLHFTTAHAGGAFGSTTRIEGLGAMAPGAIAKGTAGWIPAAAQVKLAAALSPALLARAGALVDDPDRLPRELRREQEVLMVLQALSKGLTGQLAVYGSWTAGPVPQATAVIGITGEAIDPLLDLMSQAAGGQDAGLAGAERSWNFETPIGTVTVARTKDRLIASLDAAEVTAQLAGPQAAPASIPDSSVLWMAVDAPTIGRKWLPNLFQLAAAANETLGRDRVRNLGYMLYSVQRRNELPETPVKPTELLDLDQWDWKNLDALFGSADRIDASLAIFGAVDGEASPDSPVEGSAIVAVLRTGAAQWRIASTEGPKTIDDPKVLDALLGNRRHLAGPAPKALAVVTLPEAAVFDKRWLPPITTVVKHLRPWTLRLGASATGAVTIREEGLPGASVGIVMGAHGLWMATQELAREAQRKLSRRLLDEYKETQPEIITALEHLQQVVQQSQRETRTQGGPDAKKPPATLSAVEGVVLEELAPLFGGKTPTAAQLDALGVFAPEAGWGEPLWLVRLDDTHMFGVSVWDAGIYPADASLPPGLRGSAKR